MALYFGKLIGDEIAEIKLDHWLAEVNETKKLAKRNPTHPEVKSWTEQAKRCRRDFVLAASNLKRVDRLLA